MGSSSDVRSFTYRTLHYFICRYLYHHQLVVADGQNHIVHNWTHDIDGIVDPGGPGGGVEPLT